MAAPTLYKQSYDLGGGYGYTICSAIWTSGAPDNYADELVLDISTLDGTPTFVRTRHLYVLASPGLSVDFEFDATTDELISRTVIGVGGDSQDHTLVVPKRNQQPQDGHTPDFNASGFTGDIVLTTRSAADGDEMFARIEWSKG